MKKLLIILFVIGCGPQGAQGPPGNSNGCTVLNVVVSAPAPNGGTMIRCTDGTSSLILNGSNGAAGTLVSPVQFCPGSTSYPNEFNEIGFCIDKNLYAVYSKNDGFLVFVPPGNYSSNGINSSCNFTVNLNCIITH